MNTPTFECPNCGADLPDRERHLPCGECGQRPPRARPAAAMAGHAIALSCKHARADNRDAARMRSYVTLRNAVHRRAWMMILSGLAGGRP